MAKVCDECGKELSFWSHHELDDRPLCGACLVAVEDQRHPSTPVAAKLRTVPTGGGVADAFRVLAWLVIAGGVIMAIFTIELGYMALVSVVASVFYALLLFGFAAVIDLLRIIAAGGMSGE